MSFAYHWVMVMLRSNAWVAPVLLPVAAAVITVWFGGGGGGPCPLPLLPPHDAMIPRLASDLKHTTIIKN
jgi:hypothetical protein